MSIHSSSITVFLKHSVRVRIMPKTTLPSMTNVTVYSFTTHTHTHCRVGFSLDSYPQSSNDVDPSGLPHHRHHRRRHRHHHRH